MFSLSQHSHAALAGSKQRKAQGIITSAPLFSEVSKLLFYTIQVSASYFTLSANNGTSIVYTYLETGAMEMFYDPLYFPDSDVTTNLSSKRSYFLAVSYLVSLPS